MYLLRLTMRGTATKCYPNTLVPTRMAFWPGRIAVSCAAETKLAIAKFRSCRGVHGKGLTESLDYCRPAIAHAKRFAQVGSSANGAPELPRVLITAVKPLSLALRLAFSDRYGWSPCTSCATATH